jgi:AraC-like DNA-binding protein
MKLREATLQRISERVPHSNNLSVPQTATRKSHIYLAGELGHIIAFSAYPDVNVQSLYAIIKLSPSDEPLTTTLDGVSYKQAAIVTRPAHTLLRYNGIPGIAFVIYPRHPLYRAINAIPAPGVVPINRRFFRHFDAQLLALVDGRMKLAEAREVFDAICKLIGELLPPPPALDARVAKALECLHADCKKTTAELAATTALSRRQLERLFARDIGIDIRRYKLALQLGKAVTHYHTGISLADYARAIGFASEQQFATAFEKVHGAPPSYFQLACNIHV